MRRSLLIVTAFLVLLSLSGCIDVTVYDCNTGEPYILSWPYHVMSGTCQDPLGNELPVWAVPSGATHLALFPLIDNPFRISRHDCALGMVLDGCGIFFTVEPGETTSETCMCCESNCQPHY